MRSEQWRLNGETLKFGRDGMLVDGQNRCTACVRSQTPFKTLVVFGIDSALFNTMDIGTPRNAADLFQTAGIANAALASSTVRWVMILRSESPGSLLTFPPATILSYHQDGKVDSEMIQHSLRTSRRANLICEATHAQLAAIHHEFAEVESVMANEFFGLWGAGDAWFDTLNAHLAGWRTYVGGGLNIKRPQYYVTGSIIQAWNIFRMTGSRRKLRRSGKNAIDYTTGPFESWG